MTDDEKLAKLQEFEDQQWTDFNHEMHDNSMNTAILEDIERCQRIRANLNPLIFLHDESDDFKSREAIR